LVCQVTFEDRDVILVNRATAGLSVGPAVTGQYADQVVLATPAGPLSFDRGWVSVQGRYLGKSFRFVNTHLETEDFPVVQQAQAKRDRAAQQQPGQTGRLVGVGRGWQPAGDEQKRQQQRAGEGAEQSQAARAGDLTAMATAAAGTVHQAPAATQPAGWRRQQGSQQQRSDQDGQVDGDG
jgi:hypothetical protein